MDNPHKCPKCGKWYELNEENFHRDASKPSGFACYCKRCAMILQRLGRKKTCHLARENLEECEHFTDFDRRSLNERCRRPTGHGLSMYKPV